MAKYVCVSKCFHRSRRYVPGVPYVSVAGEKVPKHFEKVKGKDGEKAGGGAKQETKEFLLAVSEMTNASLMESLVDLKVDFPSRANKLELVELLIETMESLGVDVPDKVGEGELDGLLKRAQHTAIVKEANNDGMGNIFE